ncbi:MAG: fumarate hydratase [Oscillospiraceae bacterium]|nr:fumarate hydratase [Oscillospiraceae bacterium]
MREINVSQVSEVVADLCIKSNVILPENTKKLFNKYLDLETDLMSRDIIDLLIKNYEFAQEKQIPICQDTGIAVVFLKIGQDVRLTGGSIKDAVNKGVREGYLRGYLRCSVVSDPVFSRKNTKDNTPAIIYIDLVEGDKIEILVAPKGFGSENMSKIKMMTPSAGEEQIIDFVLETVKSAGASACPPMVIGVGIGGDFEYSAYLSKKALCRDVELRNQDERYKNLELKILDSVNNLNIGPQGLGGKTTALAVNIEWAPTHIASIPVAVNIGCHATRHSKIII